MQTAIEAMLGRPARNLRLFVNGERVSNADVVAAVGAWLQMPSKAAANLASEAIAKAVHSSGEPAFDTSMLYNIAALSLLLSWSFQYRLAIVCRVQGTCMAIPAHVVRCYDPQSRLQEAVALLSRGIGLHSATCPEHLPLITQAM